MSGQKRDYMNAGGFGCEADAVAALLAGVAATWYAVLAARRTAPGRQSTREAANF
jgi:hypothetical protein